MGNFFHTPKSKRYTYKPRYYSEIAEKRKEREDRIGKEVEAEKQGKTYGVSRKQLENYITMNRKVHKKSNVRILIILALLLALIYFFFM